MTRASRTRLVLVLLALGLVLPAGCADDASGPAASAGDGDGSVPYPAPDAWKPLGGPGGPSVVFDEAELYEHCAYLDGGDDPDFHNLVQMFDGYLVMPFSPETGGGGMAFFDFSDPCDPQLVGTAASNEIRESHTIGFAPVDDHWYAVTASISAPLVGLEGGIMFWDVTDPANPTPGATLYLPGFSYFGDAYSRVTLSTFWQYPYVYVGGADNGVYIVDASDPTDPQLVGTYGFDPVIRVGQVQAIGTLLVVSAAEGPSTALLDISNPESPQPIAGGRFEARDPSDTAREPYFSNVSGGHIFYPIKDGAGGLLVYDIHDPTNPTLAGWSETGNSGGYVFVKDDMAFQGESSEAVIYDVSDLDAIEQVATLELEGDLDTASPIGNVVVLSVDDEAAPNEASAVVPVATEVDTAPPEVNWVWPPDGSDSLFLTARFGVTFSEFVEPRSVFAGSVRLYETGTDPDTTRVDGYATAQEVIVNFVPAEPLKPGTSYTLDIPAGGVVDHNGNAIAETFTATFVTVGG